MVASRSLEHIGYQLCRDGGARAIFLVLSCVRVVGDDGGDPPRRSIFACADDDTEFHDMVIDVGSRGGGLEDKD